MYHSTRDPRICLRSNGEAHHQFISSLKKRWGEVFRVRIGKDRGEKVLHKWCLETLTGEYAYSEGREVFYFDNPEDATIFAIRF